MNLVAAWTMAWLAGAGAPEAWCPSAEFDGKQLVVAWSSPEGVHAATLQESGEVRALGRIAPGAVVASAVAGDVVAFLLVSEAASEPISVMRLRAGQPLDASPLALGRRAGGMDIAGSSTRFMVVWS